MKKILIVEDDQLVATAYKKRFQEAGYAVEWAPDGLEGIKMVTAVKPDVVLLDLLMPRLDGIEVLKYIRGHPDLKYLPVVVFSNSYMTNLVENAWRAGADQCLMKASTTPAQLFDVVNKAIQKAATRVSGPPSAAASAPVNPLGMPAPTMTPRPPIVSPGGPVMPAAAPVSPLQRPPQPAPRPQPSPISRPIFPTAPAPALPAAAPEKIAQPELDPEFQDQIRQLFLNSAPAKLAAVREAATAFVQDQGSSMQMPLLADLFRKVHSLTGNAAVAGCGTIAHYASTFEAFLQELQHKPRFINDSTVRTVMQSLDLLEDLLKASAAAPPQAPSPTPPLSMLVVHGDSMLSQAIGMAVEPAGFESQIAADPAQAMNLLNARQFASAIIAVDLPGMSGFELCAQLQSLQSHANTPVIFVTTLAEFGTHANPEVLGANDIVASPFLLIELSMKAATQQERLRMQQQAAGRG